MSAFKRRKEKDCLNCGKMVEENFCTHCGQENIVVKEDALQMVSHAVADYFHFEHRFFGTIKPLLLKPGQLTKAYVEGKRVAFIHPIRLYIFISIIFFLVVLNEKRMTENDGSKKIEVTEKLPKTTESLIAAQKDSLTASETREAKNKWTNNWATAADYEKYQAALPKGKRDGFIKHYYNKRTLELNKYPDPKKKFLEDFLHNIPKMMFLLLPLFALILKLVYINKKRYYYEHLIYSFHVHSAIFLSVLATMLLQWLFNFVYNIDGWLYILCFTYILWYIYRSLRTFYGSTRWITVLKIFFLSFCYNIVLILCFLIIIAVSFVMA